MSKAIAAALVDTAAWAGIHLVVGYFVHRLPVHRLERDRWLWRARPWERDGRLYERVFRIKRWKRLLPEAGAVFHGGFDKRRLTGTGDDPLRRYLLETRRAELGHWLATAPAPLFFLWNPWWLGVCMQVYAVAANAPCVLSQRYNRIRIARVLRRRAAMS